MKMPRYSNENRGRDAYDRLWSVPFLRYKSSFYKARKREMANDVGLTGRSA